MQTAKTDQTGQMPRLVRVFVGRTGHFVGFVMRQLKWFLSSPGKRVSIWKFRPPWKPMLWFPIRICLIEAILISTTNIWFCGKIWKIISCIPDKVFAWDRNSYLAYLTRFSAFFTGIRHSCLTPGGNRWLWSCDLIHMQLCPGRLGNIKTKSVAIILRIVNSSVRMWCKKVNRKVQEESQAEATANPQHQEEEKKWHRLTCA